MTRNLYYMAPKSNVRSIARHGILALNVVRSKPHIAAGSSSIADPFVNARRDRRAPSGRSIHDYVPLYWATHTPMQFVVTMKSGSLAQNDLVFFVMDAEEMLAQPETLSTDGNAASSETLFYERDGALAKIDWHIVGTPNCYSKEYKRKKCAEVLVLQRIEPAHFRAVCCFDEVAVREVRRAFGESPDMAALRMARSSTIQVARTLYYETSVSDESDWL